MSKIMIVFGFSGECCLNQWIYCNSCPNFVFVSKMLDSLGYLKFWILRVQTCPNMSKRVQTYPNVSKVSCLNVSIRVQNLGQCLHGWLSCSNVSCDMRAAITLRMWWWMLLIFFGLSVCASMARKAARLEHDLLLELAQGKKTFEDVKKEASRLTTAGADLGHLTSANASRCIKPMTSILNELCWLGSMDIQFRNNLPCYIYILSWLKNLY